MEQRDDSDLTKEETELVALIATLRMEPTPEADFEERFLYDLRERIVRDTVCCPARQRFWDHLMQYISFSRKKLAYGASTLGIGAAALGFFSFIGEEAVLVTEVSPSSSEGRAITPYEASLASLSPSVDSDAERCTSIRISKPAGTTGGTDVIVLGSPVSPFQHAGSAANLSSFPESSFDRLYPLPSFSGARRSGGL